MLPVARSDLKFALALASTLALASCARQADPPLPESYFPGIPDVSQVNTAFAPEGNGQALCAPVSVASALAWLEGDNRRESVIMLAKLLTSKKYMNTSFIAGTPLLAVIGGLEQYLKDRDIPYKGLKYAGWQWVQSANRADVPLSISWLVQGLTKRSAVWLNLGWYESPFPGYYRRRGGHWVTLVGYREGKLVVNDPGPWAGPGVNPQGVPPKATNPVLTRTEYEWEFPASPLIALPGLRTSKKRRAYIDGALILELN